MNKEKKEAAVNSPKYETKTKTIFAITIIIMMFIGGICGAVFMMLFTALQDKVIRIARDIVSNFYIFQLYICPVIMLIIDIIYYIMISKLIHQAKKQVETWNGEDEEHIELADKMLNKASKLMNGLVIILDILFAVVTYNLARSLTVTPQGILIIVTSILYAIFRTSTVKQLNKVITLFKTYAPEKKGNAYDKNFNKIWYDSCDEAERQEIHEAAYQSYLSMNHVFTIFLSASTIIGMFIPIGILCSIVIGILWYIQVHTYQKAYKH